VIVSGDSVIQGPVGQFHCVADPPGGLATCTICGNSHCIFQDGVPTCVPFSVPTPICYPPCWAGVHCEYVQPGAVDGGQLTIVGGLDADAGLHVSIPTTVIGTLTVNAAHQCDFGNLSFNAAGSLSIKASASVLVPIQVHGVASPAGTLFIDVSSGFTANSKVAILIADNMIGNFASVVVVSAPAATGVLGVQSQTDYSRCVTYFNNTIWYDPSGSCDPNTSPQAESSNTGAWVVRQAWLWVVVAVVAVGLPVLAVWLFKRHNRKDRPEHEPLSPVPGRENPLEDSAHA